MNEESIQRAAAMLKTARLERRRIDGLPAPCRPSHFDESYQIQTALVKSLGAKIHGWKIGSTSEKARNLLGISGPISAPMLEPNCYQSPARLVDHPLFMRALECEFAFRLKSDLPGKDAPYDATRVLKAVATLHPAIEISDSRYTDWTKVGGPSIVADNSNDGAFVLGPGLADWQKLDLGSHQVTLTRNGVVAARGSGGEVLEGPVGVMVWLANSLAERGQRLQAGQVITTGSCTGVVMGEPGDKIRADFGLLGQVEILL